MRLVLRTRGFTLVELMVAIAIMALLLMAVSPGVNNWMVNVRIRNAASAIEQGLQQARQEAIRRNQSVRFSLVTSAPGDPTRLDNSCALSNTSGSWVVSVRDPAGKCAIAPSATTDPMLVASHAIGDGGQGVSVQARQSDGTTAANSISFNGLGSVTGAASIGRVDVSATVNPGDHRSMCVEVSGVGAARLCDPALLPTDPRACRGACAI